MLIVIDIPEDTFRKYKLLDDNGITDKPIHYIAHGTPLPKSHGRLIDGDKLLRDIERKNPVWWNDQGSKKAYARLVYYWAVKEAPTIIMPK